jgi:hypothetical protein
MKLVALVATGITLLGTSLMASPTEAATTWTAHIGTSYGSATVAVGTTTRLGIAAKSFRAATTYTVSLRRGSCASLGSIVLSKPMRTSSAGKITATLSLTAAQARLAKLPMSIRVGTRCGTFAAPTPAPSPTPTPVPTPTGTPIPVALDTWCDTTLDSCASAYVNWSGSVPALDQTVDVAQLGRTSYAALAWNGGYIGVQNGGNSVSGQVGPTALFSLGGAGVTIRPLADGTTNPNCEGGFDTGSGASCRIHLTRPIQNGDRYVYRVTQLTGGWLHGEIVLPDGSVLWIADLKPGPAASASFASISNFIEYFGPKVLSSSNAPTSTVTFSRPGDGIEFSLASRIGGVCANAYREDVPFGISLTTFGIGSCS